MPAEPIELPAPSPAQPAEWYADGLRFTCTQCGNCCTGPAGYVWFTDAEAQQIADRLGITVAEMRTKYAKRYYGRWSLTEHRTEHGLDCVFLRRDEAGRALCGIYDVRPRQCRTWPFWPENLETPGAWKRAAKGCPGMKAGDQGVGQHHKLTQIRVLRDSTDPGA